MTNFDYKCEEAVLLDINILWHPGSNCTIYYQIKMQFYLGWCWCLSDARVEERGSQKVESLDLCFVQPDKVW